MLTGLFFFSLAIASGLYAFADTPAHPADIAEAFFYACLLLASVSFAVCLGRAQRPVDGDDRFLRVDGAGLLLTGD